MHTVNKVFLIIAISVLFIKCENENSINEQTTQFKDVSELIDSLGSFSGMGYYTNISNSPSKFTAHEFVLNSEPDDIKSETLKRTMVYNLIRTFAFTNVDTVEISVSLFELDLDTQNKNELTNYSISKKFNRVETYNSLKSIAEMESFNDLFGMNGYDGNFIEYSTSDLGKSLMYNDTNPGLNSAFDKIMSH